MEVQESRFFSLSRIATIVTLVIVLSYSNTIAQDDPTSVTIEQSNKKVNHNFFLGGKLGLIFVFGIEMDYIIQTHEINRVYFAAAIQSSLIINSANIGGGFFLGKTGVGLGCRYHHLLWFDIEKDSKIQPGYGPEVVWNKTIGTKYIINLHAGGIITEGSFFPDISFGVFLPLNK